ncbi:hypothetical protein SpiGrapes_3051 [Sphaerochaeta pleomorpha str. Grapes]|uniref:Outer membrane protein beta-barrel domain-containing protein n=1 Tax=Sphaerochaeta pleomorpha (strain ATCC BAA-1885 / DSM 22778 / Grapes) TaxID=158190 RepID=G8QYF2_SPHPG|nr:hypothetical protein [Sphaerochaeta pleomorpha]AEV30799.1 hypothetical protein SpiGrapes_3051 [Sphaerochaeta pleomorpha str. Grapes]
MKSKRVFALLLVTLMVSPLFAKVGYTYALGVTNSYYMSVPHFEDELPFRSSYAYGISVSPIGFSFGEGNASLDVKILHVGDSIVFGNYIARGFWELGMALRLSYQLNPKFGIFLDGGTEINYYDKIEEAFASFTIGVGPQFTLVENPRYHLDLTLPVTVHLRKEITAPTVGIGLRYSYFPLGSKDKEEVL